MKTPDYIVLPVSVLNQDVSYLEKIIYGLILSLQDNDGYCKATNGYIGKLLGIHKESVSRHISILKDFGLIKISYQYPEQSITKVRIIKPLIKAEEL